MKSTLRQAPRMMAADRPIVVVAGSPTLLRLTERLPATTLPRRLPARMRKPRVAKARAVAEDAEAEMVKTAEVMTVRTVERTADSPRRTAEAMAEEEVVPVVETLMVPLLATPMLDPTTPSETTRV